MAYSVGIGLTNACNLACAHCYRPTDRIDDVSLEQINTICETLPVGSMGMGTGENILHPQFEESCAICTGEGVKLSIASNGHSLIADERRTAGDVQRSGGLDRLSQREPSRTVCVGRATGNWCIEAIA